jgi:hypothetical protein
MSNKKLVRDILLSIPIGLMYIFFINKLIELLNSDLICEEKVKRTIVISIVAVIVGFVLAFKVFGVKPTYNRIAKYSLILGSSIIFINSIIYHWPQLSTDTKLIIVGITFILSIVLSYKL